MQQQVNLKKYAEQKKLAPSSISYMKFEIIY